MSKEPRTNTIQRIFAWISDKTCLPRHSQDMPRETPTNRIQHIFARFRDKICFLKPCQHLSKETHTNRYNEFLHDLAKKLACQSTPAPDLVTKSTVFYNKLCLQAPAQAPTTTTFYNKMCFQAPRRRQKHLSILRHRREPVSFHRCTFAGKIVIFYKYLFFVAAKKNSKTRAF